MTIKQKIFSKLENIESEILLQEIYDFISHNSASEKLYELNDLEQQSIKEGINDIKKGNVYSNDTNKAIVEKWLAEKLNGQQNL